VEGGAIGMSGSTEERVVEMTFKGDSFTSDVKTAISALGALTSALGKVKGSGSENGIDEIDASAKKFSLAGMESSLQTLTSKFSTLGIIGITALSNIVNRAINAGVSIAKALLIDPIKEGFQNYETKINAIQTVLANTAQAGTTLNQVTAALANLNTYANKTVYNFSQMAQNVGTFTAAGVGLNVAVSSIKGIANLAALSGSSAEQATGAMYQLSQAIAAGRVKLQDWNSVVNAGLGGKVFQTALINTARNQGVAIDQLIKKTGSFRQSLQSGWLTSKILTDTLDQFTGDLTDQQLRAMGYTEQQSQAILKQGKIAVNAATQVRTLTQLQQDLTEEVGTAYATIWGTLFGNITTATALFTKIHVVLEAAFTNPIYALNNLLVQFVQLGGRDDIIQGLSNVFESLGEILKIVGHAFSLVFPPTTALNLLKIAFAFETFTGKLFLTNKGIEDLTTIAIGFFSIIKIVVDIIKGFGTSLDVASSSAKKAGGGFLGLVANVAQFITKIQNVLTSGEALNRFFTLLGTILSIPVKAIGLIIDALGGFTGIMDKAVDSISPFMKNVSKAFAGFAGAVAKGITSGNFESVAALINQVLLGGVLVSIRKFITNLGKDTGGEKTGFLDTIKESFEQLTDSLKTMQTTLKSKTLEAIAIAVALLSVSLIALSFVNTQNLTKALTAITALFLDLIGALTVVTKVSGATGIVKMAAIAFALNLLATSIVILAGAVAILAQFSWAQLEHGLTAIAVLLVELVAATTLMGANAKGTVASAYAMEIMAVALNLMAVAVGKFGKMNLGTLAKGISSIAAILAEMTLFNEFGGKQSLLSAAGIAVLGAALLIIAKAIGEIGALPTESLIKGLTGIAAALLIIGLAVTLMPPNMIVTAASLLVVAASLVILANVLTTMGGMSWTEIVKGLTALAGALALIVLAMIGMEGALPGAAALLVVAASLAILTPVLVALSQLGWQGIAIALVALAGAFIIIGAAGLLLGPLVPFLLAFGAAVVLMGVGLLAAGAGVALFAVGITAVAAAMAASGVAMLTFVTSFLALIPATFTAIGRGIVAFATAVGQGAPALVTAFVAVLTALLTAIITLVPIIVKAFGVLLDGILNLIPKYAPRVAAAMLNLLLLLLTDIGLYLPKFVTAGVNIVLRFLSGIAQNVGKIVTAATNIVIAFINAIGVNALRIEQAGALMVIRFINGTANQIRADTPQLRSAAINLAGAIIDGMTFGIFGGIPDVENAAISMAKSALNAAKSFLGINSPSKEFRDQVGAGIPEGTVVGIQNGIGDVNDAVEDMGKQALDTVTKTMGTLGDSISTNLNLSPTITPVLDLTKAQSGFNTLNSLSKSQLLNVSATTNKATSIAASNSAAATALGATSTDDNSVTFNQYNTSPVALSATDIYRQTNNQLSKVRKAINANAS
jgi:tape measure domain-containing protein